MRNILLVVFSTLFALAILEAALRIYEPDTYGEILKTTTSPHGMYYDLIPGARGVVLGRAVSINEQGYRGHAYPKLKSADAERILFFGDSHTFSYGADDESTYPAVVEGRLNEGRSAYQSLNFGVPGQDLGQIFAMAYDKIPAFDPDLVVLTIHEGDLLEGSGTIVLDGQDRDIGTLYRIKMFLLRNSYVARLVIPYGAGILRQLFAWSPGVTAAERHEIENDGPAWREAKQQLSDLNDYLRHREVRLVVVLFPNMVDFEQKAVHANIPLMAAWLSGNEIPVLDLLPAYSAHSPHSLTASLLDKHPNEKGYEIAGHAVAHFLVEEVGLE